MRSSFAFFATFSLLLSLPDWFCCNSVSYRIDPPIMILYRLHVVYFEYCMYTIHAHVVIYIPSTRVPFFQNVRHVRLINEYSMQARAWYSSKLISMTGIPRIYDILMNFSYDHSSGIIISRIEYDTLDIGSSYSIMLPGGFAEIPP